MSLGFFCLSSLLSFLFPCLLLRTGCHAATCPHYSHCCPTIGYLRIYIRVAAARRYYGSLHCTNFGHPYFFFVFARRPSRLRTCIVDHHSGALRVLTASSWQAFDLLLQAFDSDYTQWLVSYYGVRYSLDWAFTNWLTY